MDILLILENQLAIMAALQAIGHYMGVEQQTLSIRIEKTKERTENWGKEQPPRSPPTKNKVSGDDQQRTGRAT